MKKILCLLCLITSSTLLMGFMSVEALETEPEDKYSPYEDVYVPPMQFSEQRISELGMPETYDVGDIVVHKGWTQGSGDKYESNNNFSNATTINRTSTIYATLHTNAWWNGNDNDQDYFKFVTRTKIELALTLESLPSGCDYDVKIYDWNMQFVPGSGGYKSGNANELINITLGAGTYYVHVYSMFDHNNDSDTYELKLNSSTLTGTSFYLSAENKAQYKAAVWTSHYFPNNIDPDNYEGKPIYETIANHSGVKNTGNFDSFLTMSNNASTTKYLSRVLFVWGAEEKRQIANDLEKIYNELGRYSDNLFMKLQTSASKASLGIALIALIPGAAEAALTNISLGLSAFSILPSGNSKRVDEHRAWLSALIVTLRTSADVQGEQVIRITSWYSCEFVSTSRPGSYGGGGYIYVKFHWTDTSLESLSHNSNYINYYQGNNIFYGDVTPIIDISDFGKIFK
ncbi:hypothetical protein BN85409740 [Alteracholeplasma palmae J233]|uniref:Peptidase C-terminal archaeal/bacterial domain-containing protein n=1 Tax=Alteracholeplasma palmae (strain ATCC 49389 / J233) TaxID=1318466 RepID=U4KRY4_ALTPJ|nr:hypothetical protein [Alteracholeplasma palmae]CCV64551.1 hypothetical protein BN85409740 [Alteracholeplasma palmae J233]